MARCQGGVPGPARSGQVRSDLCVVSPARLGWPVSRPAGRRGVRWSLALSMYTSTGARRAALPLPAGPLSRIEVETVSPATPRRRLEATHSQHFVLMSCCAVTPAPRAARQPASVPHCLIAHLY